MKYYEYTKEMLQKELENQMEIYNEYKARNLSYDMTRGKPGADQLDICMEMLDTKYLNNCKSQANLDCRNYGILDGIPEAKQLFAEILNVTPKQVIVCGNASLNIMHDMISRFLLLGVGNNAKPWCKNEKVKFLCPVPGYDRHFAICELYGIEMINVPMDDNGPDMDLVEKLVANDEAIKGMWIVPKYSNPSGIVYSDNVISRLASMKCAADDFRIFCDDAYTVHFLDNEPAKQANIISECAKAGNPDRAIIFTSTSKITFPGAGISAYASSEANIECFVKWMGIQTIGHNKLNQLRHVNFLKNYDGIIEIMKKQAEILKPKFDAVLNVLDEKLSGLDILQWTIPHGGYFISIDTLDGCAKRVVSLAKECGVALTPAGATFPYKKDPNDKNIRIAPSFPPSSQITMPIEVLCVCIKIASLEKLLNN